MFDGFWQFVWTNHAGDLASVIGLIVVMIGFYKTYDAASRARIAVQELRRMFLQVNTIADLTAVMQILADLKKLQFIEAWPQLIERYSTLRLMLVEIHTANRGFTEDQRTTITETIQQLKQFETTVSRFMRSGKVQPNHVAMNSIISEQMDKLQEILTILKQEVGVDNNANVS